MFLPVLALLGHLVALSLPASADTHTEPTAEQYVKFKLVAASSAVGTSGRALLGLEVKLEPGWVFYWKKPGRYGIAPKFDWSGSVNLESSTIHWPAPITIVYSEQPPVSTLGYTGSVLLPVIARLAQRGKPVELHCRIEYAVCNDICLTGSTQLRHTLPGGSGAPTAYSDPLNQALRHSSE